MGATSSEQVVQQVLPPMCEIVGAHGIELLDADGNRLGAYGDRSDGNGRVVSIDVDTLAVLVALVCALLLVREVRRS